MATHPGDRESEDEGADNAAPNPTQLPVEPEFGPALEPVEPEDAKVKPPVL